MLPPVIDSNFIQEFFVYLKDLQVDKYYIPTACTTPLSPGVCSLVLFEVSGVA